MFQDRLIVAAIALLVMCGAVRAADENPLKKANVGDWVAYKIAGKMGGTSTESEMKQTVIKKSDVDVTLEMAMKAAGMEMPKQTVTIKFDQKYEPWKQNPNATVKELGSGTEKLTIGDKTYDTEWKEFESTSNAMGREIKSKSKIWTSKDVPLGGMVKMTSDIAGLGSTTMELTGSGTGK
jgi:hypothetical protein